ncbi:hypothetical protein [Microcoleus sp. bin38.metabat.b11b12b14.051]|uniref:hypothetical protein n=1 Tax=Microcoleus sp. bin38.metabat.b11b12b14.051 TaxID=2742709 RepID=UPI0025F7567A|nr:hypothetical protein [Microcoleus sp. bin38.metabat.b11b12b14.051]
MKVIKKTEHLLKLNNLGEMIYGAISPTVWVMGFSGIPLFMMLLIMASAGVERLSCNKIEPKIATCQLSRSSFMGLNKGEVTPIEQVKGARFETSKTTDSEGTPMTVKNVFLVTKEGELLLATQSAEDANSFNKYIQKSTGGLVIETDNRLLFFGIMLFPSLFLVIGFRVFSRTLRYSIVETYIFDKTASTLTTKKRGIWVNKVAERSLAEISEVKLETEHTENGILCEIYLLIDGGDRLFLSSSLNHKKQQKMADLIRGYLDGRSV